MPIIPTYEMQTTAPAVRMPRYPQSMAEAPVNFVNPAALTEGYQAGAQAQLSLAQSFDVLRRQGDELADMGLRYQHVQSLAALNRAKTQASTELDEFLIGIEERGDYQNFEDDYRKKAEEVKQKYREGLGGLYLEKFEADYDADAIRTYPKVRKFARAKAKDDWISTLPGMMDQAKQRQLDGPNPRHADEVTAQIDHGVSMGMISKVEAEKLKMGFRRDLMDTEIKAGIMTNPGAVLERLKDTAYYSGLDPEVRLAYQEKAELAIRRGRAEQEEAIVNGAYEGLYKRFAGDPTLAINHLSNPDNAKALGLDLKQSAYLTERFQHLRQEMTYQDNSQRKAAAEKDSDQVFKLLNQGKLSAAVGFALKSPNLTEESKFRVKEMVQRMAQPEGPNKTEIKAINYTNALIGIRTGKIKDLEGLLKTGVYGHDLKSLMDLMDQEGKDGGKTSEKKINFFSQWDKEFEQLAGTMKDEKGQPLKNRKNDFLTSLDWMMKKEKLSAHDPQVYELGKRLFDSVTVEQRPYWWDKTKRGFEVVTEKAPWVSGLDVNTSAFYDPQIPDATQEEMNQARDLLKKNKLAVTPLTKRRALLAIRQGTDISKIVISAPPQEIPRAAQARIEQMLKAKGQKVTPGNIKHIWDNYGDKVMQD